ncbi:Zpr1p [Sugiyamaella lignohabitans]|uniref:Zpr1p n=1 Tax=Sugiyamaella lignohabitans TaxID=796027 RepID=A0A167F7B7_9ASCO|nr:Zpr1p [Sugiyamaella lignohabitans]ANB14902.1 Zpr1p [Sugiyamaella lignohabitans]
MSDAPEKHIATSPKEDEVVNKKLKVDEQPENLFTTVGEAAQEVDNMSDEPEVIGSESLRNTGAADAEGHPVQEIDSLCMNCHENGVTKLLLTKIPYFREVIVMSFECGHCGFKNSEIQPASAIAEKGAKYILQVTEKADLNRQVVKSESCTCTFAELDVEIPPKRGQLTTVEGLLSQIHFDLSSDQPARKEIDPENYAKIQAFLDKVQSAINGEILPLTVTVDDPAGNSWIEFNPGEPAHKWSHVEYFRTIQQTKDLGMAVPDSVQAEADAKDAAKSAALAAAADKHRNPSAAKTIQEEETEIENFSNEVQVFEATCPACHSDCPTHMKVVDIPHFKEVIIMSTVCEHCGYKSNEVKTGGAVPEKGRRIALRIDDADDLARDILKSETCGLVIPELDLDLTPGTLGGRFTTVEGLLRQVHEELETRVFTETSDSMDTTTLNRWKNFLARLMAAINGEIKFTIVMEDPLAASYIQNVYAPDPDPNMEIEDYERTHDQNEDLGLNDMAA